MFPFQVGRFQREMGIVMIDLMAAGAQLALRFAQKYTAIEAMVSARVTQRATLPRIIHCPSFRPRIRIDTQTTWETVFALPQIFAAKG